MKLLSKSDINLVSGASSYCMVDRSFLPVKACRFFLFDASVENWCCNDLIGISWKNEHIFLQDTQRVCPRIKKQECAYCEKTRHKQTIASSDQTKQWIAIQEAIESIDNSQCC